ncbi:DinB family protein [Sciscionella marina]|uniref:DinB family protein n=1 Tax=Sciscionella marina TaxID=508770 RepID=UPI000377574A|nr:DinB family protein [Sciscionella marina]
MDESGAGTDNGLRHGITEPAHRGGERTALLGFLRRQRELVAWKVRDIPEEVLHSVSTPSGLTLPGVVRHLTNVERSWIRDVFAGQDGLVFDWTEADPDGEFHVPGEVTMAELLADYAAEARRCEAVVSAAASLDVPSATRGFSLRWILLHLIEETARHLGHIDLLREKADGRVGEEPGEEPS